MPTGPTKSYSGLYNPPINQSDWPNKARTVSESLCFILFESCSPLSSFHVKAMFPFVLACVRVHIRITSRQA